MVPAVVKMLEFKNGVQRLLAEGMIIVKLEFASCSSAAQSQGVSPCHDWPLLRVCSFSYYHMHSGVYMADSVLSDLRSNYRKLENFRSEIFRVINFQIEKNVDAPLFNHVLYNYYIKMNMYNFFE